MNIEDLIYDQLHANWYITVILSLWVAALVWQLRYFICIRRLNDIDARVCVIDRPIQPSKREYVIQYSDDILKDKSCESPGVCLLYHTPIINYELSAQSLFWPIVAITSWLMFMTLAAVMTGTAHTSITLLVFMTVLWVSLLNLTASVKITVVNDAMRIFEATQEIYDRKTYERCAFPKEAIDSLRLQLMNFI